MSCVEASEMAIFHCEFKLVRRREERMPGGKMRSGRSVVAAAAYRAGEKLRDERADGVEHDYSRRSSVVDSEILAPKESPEWVQNRERLWNEVEASERRKDAQLAREIELALPHELTRDQQQELVREFCQDQFVDRGMVADISYHDAPDGQPRNDHAHVLLTMREIGPEGFGKKVREWNDRSLVAESRERWAELTNRALEREGHGERIDHRSLEVQRQEAERKADFEKAYQLARAPQAHKGVTITALERSGVETPGVRAFRERTTNHELGHDLQQQRELILERSDRHRAMKMLNQRDPTQRELEAAEALKNAINRAPPRSAQPLAKAQSPSAPDLPQPKTKQQEVSTPQIPEPKTKQQEVPTPELPKPETKKPAKDQQLELARSDHKACYQMLQQTDRELAKERERAKPQIEKQMAEKSKELDQQRRVLARRHNHYLAQERDIEKRLGRPWNKIPSRREGLETARDEHRQKRQQVKAAVGELDDQKRRLDPNSFEGRAALKEACAREVAENHPELVKRREELTKANHEHLRQRQQQRHERERAQDNELGHEL